MGREFSGPYGGSQLAVLNLLKAETTHPKLSSQSTEVPQILQTLDTLNTCADRVLLGRREMLMLFFSVPYHNQSLTLNPKP